jgi:carbamoyltransferase
MSIVLGLNTDHPDAAAVLVRDGKIVAAIAEERLGDRVKHTAHFPATAIRSVLRLGGVALADVDRIAVAHRPHANLRAKIAFALAHPGSALRAVGSVGRRFQDQRSLSDRITSALGEPVSSSVGVDAWEHHHAHAASSFFTSGFQEAACFTYDGSGDLVSALGGAMDARGLHGARRVYLPHSLGFFYTAICQFIGFQEFGEEYKVMGLASYGRPRFADAMREMVSPTSIGGFQLDPRYFQPPIGFRIANTDGRPSLPRLYSDALVERLGRERTRGEPITEREQDLAASAQLVFEEVVLECLRQLRQRTGLDRLVTAGGCALNGVCNARIARSGLFRETYIHGAAGDDGTAVGAAMLSWWQLDGGRDRPLPGREIGAYFGEAFDSAAVSSALGAAGLSATARTEGELVDEVAALLAAGQVVGWFQGRSEWGPRALGNRSILAHPGLPDMKDTINAKVKRREGFRPFAPSVLADRVGDLFTEDVRSPFMMHVVPFRHEHRDQLKAVVHVDGTGRLQSVTAEQNPLYARLISRFAALTGLPLVLNTSFNENEPIVETPAQAIDCFLRTDIDALALGPFILRKATCAPSTSPR